MKYMNDPHISLAKSAETNRVSDRAIGWRKDRTVVDAERAPSQNHCSIVEAEDMLYLSQRGRHILVAGVPAGRLYSLYE